MTALSPKQALNVLFRANEVVRTLDPEMPTQMVQTFLAVAIQPGLTMAELGDQVGLSQSSVSRNVAALGKFHRYGKAGHDVVSAEEDPVERRRKIVKLTPKGKRLADQIIAAIQALAVAA